MNPLYSHLEVIKTNVWIVDPTRLNNQAPIYKVGGQAEIALKKSQITKINTLAGSDRLTTIFECWVLKLPDNTNFSYIEGFGDKKIEYKIINKTQAPLKVINKVFGLRCEVTYTL